MNVLIIGGTGIISTAVTALCVQKGWDVTLLNRGGRKPGIPEAVTYLHADMDREAEVARQLEGRTFDVVADFIVYTPEQAERDIRLFTGRTGQYIFISSASAYKAVDYQYRITESTPLYNPHWQYSRDKAACEQRLLRAFMEDGFPMTIVRPSHTYGDTYLPLALHGAGGVWQVLERMRQSKPVIVPGDGTSLWTVTHNSDFAVAFEGLMGRRQAIGEAFHITSDESLPWNIIYEEVGSSLGVRPILRHVSTDMLVKYAPDMAPGLYGDKMHSAIFDNSKIKRLVPWFMAKTSFDRGVRRTVANILARPGLQKPDPAFDKWCDEMAARIDAF